MIYYKVMWIFGVLGVFLPMMKLAKLGISMWILLPQLKGEFFIYHIIETYILHFEKYLLQVRMKVGSTVTIYSAKAFAYIVSSCLTSISQDSIEEMLNITEDLIKQGEDELKMRQSEGKGRDNRRDTVVVDSFNREQFSRTL